MVNFVVEVHDEEFQSWLKRTENAFVHMIETMMNVAEVIRENTVAITPVDTTRLGKSFKIITLTDNARMKVLEIQMSALNPHTGYDYAAIQHENPTYTHKPPTRMWYLKEGILESQSGAFQIIEEDYLSLFNRGYIF